MAKKKVITPAMLELLRRAGSDDFAVASVAQRELAVALTLPLKQAVLHGDISFDIYQEVPFLPGQAVEFPLDLIAPGQEAGLVAVTVPNVGRIPEYHVESDYLMVPTYMVGAAVDWSLKYSRDARWDVVARAMQLFEAMFVRKKNLDAWHTLLAAAKGRNTVVYDSAATAGLFTKRLVALMEVTMRRNAGGNTTSVNVGKLDRLYVSLESKADMYSWDLSQVSDLVRTQILLQGPLATIGGVEIRDLVELGVGQEFETYYESTLGGTLPTDKQEIVVGLDMTNEDAFVHPVRQPLQVYEDIWLHRQNRGGVYGRQEHGFAVCDSRRCLLGAA